MRPPKKLKRPGLAKRGLKPKHVFVNENTVYVRNLSYSRNIQGLKNVFSKFGEVKYVKILVDPKTLKSQGMAFIEMADPIEVHKAILGMNGKLLDGRTIKVTTAIPMKPKPEKPKSTFKKVINKNKSPLKKLSN